MAENVIVRNDPRDQNENFEIITAHLQECPIIS